MAGKFMLQTIKQNTELWGDAQNVADDSSFAVKHLSEKAVGGGERRKFGDAGSKAEGVVVLHQGAPLLIQH